MKNYICINGKKTELTKEQLKQLGLDLPVIELTENGKIAKIGDYEFIVLEQENGIAKLLLKDTLCNSIFSKTNNDFRGSAIAKLLCEFADKIASTVGEENLLTHDVDLTADDGLTDYGIAETKMSLLTCDMYRKYVYTIDKYKVNKWWWLATPCSTKTHNWETAVKCVSPSGIVNYNFYYYDFIGVRPFCIVKSNIFVSK